MFTCAAYTGIAYAIWSGMKTNNRAENLRTIALIAYVVVLMGLLIAPVIALALGY